MATGVHYVEFTFAELGVLSCCQLGVVSAHEVCPTLIPQHRQKKGGGSQAIPSF